MERANGTLIIIADPFLIVTEPSVDAEEEAAEKERGYFCPHCQMTLELTGISLLRHQKKHQHDNAPANDTQTS